MSYDLHKRPTTNMLIVEGQHEGVCCYYLRFYWTVVGSEQDVMAVLDSVLESPEAGFWFYRSSLMYEFSLILCDPTELAFIRCR